MIGNNQSTKIMGICNITPDSFYDGGVLYDGCKINEEALIKCAKRIIKDGADVLDVGGESTRPGAEKVEYQEERKRVIGAIKILNKFNFPLSIDTSDPMIMEEALSFDNVIIINDIRSAKQTKSLKILREYNCYVVIMHLKGEPHNMQESPYYENLVEEVKIFFKEKIELYLSEGIDKNKIILDLGIGFGKTLEHNLELLKRVDEFKSLGFPIMLGYSRKSLITKVLNTGTPKNNLIGSVALSCYAKMKNIDWIRVHDILENYDAMKMIGAVK